MGLIGTYSTGVQPLRVEVGPKTCLLGTQADRPVSTHSSPWPLPTDWQASLQTLSLPELSGVLEDRVHEMGECLMETAGRPCGFLWPCLSVSPPQCQAVTFLPSAGQVLCTVTQNLEKLQGKENWREP